MGYLRQYIDTRRDKNIALNIDHLFKSFSSTASNNLLPTPRTIDPLDRLTFTGFLQSLADYYQAENNPISVDSDIVIFEKNTRKYTYDYLAEILNHYKKPMHFTELYNICCEKGMEISTPLNIHATIQHHPDIFGLKGQGIYGLVEWGGYFGTIGDVTERLLKERNKPIDRKELEDILCRELYISQSSIREVLFHYAHENRFVKLKNDTVALKEWQTQKQNDKKNNN